MSVCVEYPDDLIDNDEWDQWYWDDITMEDFLEWMYDDIWSSFYGYDQFLENFLEDLIADANSEFWNQFFVQVGNAPTTITPGTGWAGSTAERVYNELLTDSPTFNTIVQRFQNDPTINLGLWSIEGRKFKEMALSSLPNVNWSDPDVVQALANARKALGTTYLHVNFYPNPNTGVVEDVYEDPPGSGNTMTTKLRPFINVTADPIGLNGQPITYNDVGYALTLIHEIIHAEMAFDCPCSVAEAADIEHQHDDMAVTDQPRIETMLNEYVTASNLTFSITNPAHPAGFDYVKMMSWYGLLNNPAGYAYIISYAQQVYGVTITVGNINNPSQAEQVQLKQYGDLINAAIESLVSP